MRKVSARWHRWLGIMLILPLLGWGLTGLIFYYKPGYSQAYDKLMPHFYPIQSRLPEALNPSWLELRWLRTILGEHLLVRTISGWQQLDLQTFQIRPRPNPEATRILMNDALQQFTERYGQVKTLQGMQATTSTGVTLKLDWPTLSLSQAGPDTRAIKALYAVHYLRWTGIEWLDRSLALVMIVALIMATLLGGWLLVTRRNITSQSLPKK